MRQVWITRPGGPDVLQMREAPDPTPGPGEVRLRVRATGVNFADIVARIGMYPDAPKSPCVVGYEVAGDVDALGEGAKRFHVGDRVFGLTRFGGYTDVICVPQEQLFLIPPDMGYSEAAAIPVNYLTAYAAVVALGGVRPGQSVLIQNAGGGVGLAAIDIARVFEARIIGTASAWKHEALRERGAEHLIDYRTTDFEQAVLELTGGAGVDVVLDPLGGDSWRKGLRVLGPMGKLVCYGVSTLARGERRSVRAIVRWLWQTPWLQFTPVSLMNHNRGVLGINLGHMWGQEHLLRTWMEEILCWYNEGKVRPRVDREFALDAAPEAHRYIQQRKNLGKVVLVP